MRTIARAAALADATERKQGIGSLTETSLHRILKFYIEPRPECHEVSVDGLVVDIKNEDGITEIQTRSLDRLAPKLSRLLQGHRITVVYPVITNKEIVFMNNDGEVLNSRISPKHGRPSHILPELVKLVDCLSSENLTLRLILLSAVEYRLLGQKGHGRPHRVDRRPGEVTGEIVIRHPSELLSILPENTPTEITAAELSRLTGLRGRRASAALKTLLSLDLLRRVGSRGRAYLYSFNN